MFLGFFKKRVLLMENTEVLLVDDEKIILNSLSRELKTNNFNVATAESGEEAVAKLKASPYDLVVTDLKMEGMDGIEVLKQAKQLCPEAAVIILTGHGDLNSAIEAVRFGADDYLLKPCDIDELLFRISNCLEKQEPKEKEEPGATSVKRYEESHRIIGKDASVRELHELIQEAAGVNLPVLIQGESGTGKELVAQAIHAASPRKDKTFIAVNCAALPHELLESELFGHVKGAFTGAIRDKKGRFELADGGTIFLDEIGEMDLAVQIKLLRVLQEGEFERIGGTQTIKVDVRLISATNKELEEEVKSGNFRLDLYYRLCVVPITVPPLRERCGDVPLLAAHFLAQSGKQVGKGSPQLSADALSSLTGYPWPGNIRELQNVVQFALMKCKGQSICLEHLPAYIVENAQTAPLSNFYGRKRKLDEQSVLEALKKAKGNKVEAAKELGVARATLYRFLNDKMLDD